MRSPSRRLVPTALSALALVLGAGSAQAAELQPLRPGPVAEPFALPVPDAPRLSAAPSARAASGGRPRARSAAERYYTRDGTPITVEISKSYRSPPRDRVQSYVDFIGSRAHGPELRRLVVFIVTPQELQGRYCSPRALACYIPRYNIMVIPGEETPDGQAPLKYVVTHELGHHVANNRRNDPWRAVGYGPKRWATYKNVCRGVREGRYFPTDQNERYLQNPGENWAETYAVMHYPSVAWSYDPTLAPDDAAREAARRDVTDPWRPRSPRRRTGSVVPERPVKVFRVETPLDGRMHVSLRGPKRSNFDVELFVDGVLQKRSRASGSRDELTYDVCGVREVEVRVVRRRGAGALRLDVRVP